MKYDFIRPQEGYVAIKEIEEDNKGLQKSGQSESKAYATIVSIEEGSRFELGQLVVYNEYEGQELFKYGKVKEDGIIIIKESNILAIIN